MEIRNWLESDGRYEEGVLLYKQFGRNKTWLSTFQNLGETEFTFEQLRKELSIIAVSYELTTPKVELTQRPNQLTQKQLIHGISASDLPDAPEEIQKIVERRKYLYGHVNREHQRLIDYVESQAEFKAKLSGEIKMRDVVKAMDKLTTYGQPLPFNLIAITGNRKLDTGGEILHLQGVYQYKYHKKWEGDNSSNFDKLPSSKNVGGASNPLANRIRRIYIPDTEEIKNVDMILITHFNWKRMIY
jgi:hypothetical protein